MKERPLKAIIVAHGEIGAALLDVARHIIGELPELAAVGIGWTDGPEATIKIIEQAIEEQGQGAELLVMTDMFGGTSTNVALSFLERGHVELVTGVNLPMVLKLASLLATSRGSDETEEAALSKVAALLRDQGRRSIEVASDLIEKR